MIATPSAPPSIGAVPGPTPSRGTSAGGTSERSMDTMVAVDAERAAFHRVGAGPDLVEEHERGCHERAIHGHDVGDVPRKGAEARFDRLFVADVREERLKNGHPRSVCRWNPQSSLGHERQQP